nr:phosphomevalonate kinase [Onthophagus taurus]
MENFPKLILLFSGKRKSGKDFITDKLKDILGDQCEILKISAPIKEYFAKSLNLDLNLLMSEKPNKEEVRLEMIKWSEMKRSENPGCFCEITCNKAKPVEIWIVSDIRRKTDISWFYDTYQNKVKTIRISTDLDIREKRGFQFEKGIDDAESECDLDQYKNWDLHVTNNDSITCEKSIKEIVELININIL